MNQDYIEIELEEEPIELCNLLKLLDLAETGGHAKLLINEGYVVINDEVCTQKRKKLYSGDTLLFNEGLFKLTLAEGVAPLKRNEATPKPEKSTKAKQKKKGKSNTSVDKTTGRKPISFG